jgi:hypothetical protein
MVPIMLLGRIAAMSYVIVAERKGLSIFNRAGTASEALELAVARRRDGAEAVYVRDHTWELVPATNLERMVGRERTGSSASSPNEPVTVRVGAVAAARPEAPPPAVRTGRVRVFKAAGTQRSRD